MKEFLKKYYKWNDIKKKKIFQKKKKNKIYLGKISKKKKIKNLYTYKKKISIFIDDSPFKDLKFHYPFNFKLLNEFWKL